jgi:hypothetical protein
MAFFFDSPLALAALLLIAVAALAWRLAGRRVASVRLNLRFAAMLFVALGLAGLAAAFVPPLAEAAYAIALLTVSLCGIVLALCLFAPRPAPAFPASVALVAGFAAGLVSVLLDAPVFALASLALGAGAMVLIGLARFGEAKLAALEIIAGAAALFFGGMALGEGALVAALLLFAAGLLGVACASQARVEQQADAGIAGAIGRTGL